MNLLNSLFIVAFPISWDGVADSLRLVFCWSCRYVLKCCVDAVQHVHPSTDRVIHFCSQLLHYICNFLPQLLLKCCEVCWGDHVCSLFCWSRCCCCCYRDWSRGSRALPLVTLLNHAPLQCQMQLCFLANLEPTRKRWENGQVSLTSLKTRKASVQECNGVKYVYNSTQTMQERLTLSGIWQIPSNQKEETLNATTKGQGKGEGKGKCGQWNQQVHQKAPRGRTHNNGNGINRVSPETAQAKRQGREWRKGEGKWQSLSCFVCGGVGYSARLCPIGEVSQHLGRRAFPCQTICSLRLLLE